MPPRPRSRLRLTSWLLIGIIVGALLGWVLASYPHCWEGLITLQALRLLAQLALVTGKCLAVPLIFTSIIMGADGLEPMRGLRRLTLKTGAWIVGSSAAAALTGLGVSLILRPTQRSLLTVPERLDNADWMGKLGGGEIWVAWVLIALAIGFYRNQIEESRAPMLRRLSLAVDETLGFFLEWAGGIIPVAVGCVAAATAATVTLTWRAGGRLPPGLLGALVVGWSVYALFLLPLILFVYTRLNPGRFAAAVGPAVLAALAGGSPGEIFPLTLMRVRIEAGISNRVGGVTLAGCTALLRDGQALGWALAGVWLLPGPLSAAECLRIFLAAWLLGVAAAALAEPAGPLLLLAFVSGSAADLNGGVALTLGAIIALGGNAVSVFSQTCAAAVIARSEGEKNLLPVLPPEPFFADVLLEKPSL